MYLKIYQLDREVMVAVCDEKHIGREYSDEKAMLKVAKEFYGDSKASYEEIVNALKEATIANIVGEESVACAVAAGVIDTGHIIFIANVPHAQMVRL